MLCHLTVDAPNSLHSRHVIDTEPLAVGRDSVSSLLMPRQETTKNTDQFLWSQAVFLSCSCCRFFRSYLFVFLFAVAAVDAYHHQEGGFGSSCPILRYENSQPRACSYEVQGLVRRDTFSSNQRLWSHAEKCTTQRPGLVIIAPRKPECETKARRVGQSRKKGSPRGQTAKITAEQACVNV